MKADKALELVGRYATLTLAIKACKKRIGDHLDLCNGLKGFRREVKRYPAFSGFDGETCATFDSPTERAVDDQDTHLKGWYDDKGSPAGNDGWERFVVGDEQRLECTHCFAAHLVVRERRDLRKQLAAVKGAMTRSRKP